MTRRTPKKTPALDADKLAARKAMAKDRGTKKKAAEKK